MRARLSMVVAVVAVSLAVASVLVAAPRPMLATSDHYLSVTLNGNGSGSFITTDGMVDCRIVKGYVDPRNVCDQIYAYNTRVDFSVMPAPGSCLDNSPCDDEGIVAFIYLTSDFSPTYSFYLIPYSLTAARAGTGTGSITGSPSGINCGLSCSVGQLYYGDVENLTATPGQGSYFAGWTGACAGQDETCTITIHGNSLATATFTAGAPPTPVAPSPSPTASITPTTNPTATPKVTLPPGATATPAAPASTTSSIPGATVAASGPLAATPDPASTEPGETPVGPSFTGAAGGATTGPSAAPTPAGNADSGPPVLWIALVVVVLVVGIGIGFGFRSVRPKPGSS